MKPLLLSLFLLSITVMAFADEIKGDCYFYRKIDTPTDKFWDWYIKQEVNLK